MGRSSQLSPPDFHRLDWACRPVTTAFHTPVYVVGSVLVRSDYRDVDLRLILDDDHPVVMLPKRQRLLLNIALSDLIAKSANLPTPIDFQIQSVSEANVPENDGVRSPIGVSAVGRI